MSPIAARTRLQWDLFKKYPWGVLAHSTHLRGVGTFESGTETPRIRVTLATQISEERCRRANLGFLDPDSTAMRNLKESSDPETLVVPRAGETLFRCR